MLRMTPFCDTVFMAGRLPVGSAVVDTGELRARSHAKEGWDIFSEICMGKGEAFLFIC